MLIQSNLEAVLKLILSKKTKSQSCLQFEYFCFMNLKSFAIEDIKNSSADLIA